MRACVQYVGRTLFTGELDAQHWSLDLWSHVRNHKDLRELMSMRIYHILKVKQVFKCLLVCNNCILSVGL